jgi:hypothetical protein
MLNPLNTYLLSPVVVGTLSVMCAAADKPAAPVSGTFQDVLKRVEGRDADSGAIMGVRPRADAPRYGKQTLKFSISQRNADEVVIVLSARTMTAEAYEQYVLKADEAMRAELAKQKLYEQQQAEKYKRWVEAQKLKIPAATGGRLQFGMGPDEIKKLLGSPAEEHIWQKAGGLTLVYRDMTLTFDGGLVDVTLPEKRDADDQPAKP